MEAAFLSGLLNIIGPRIWMHIQEKHELRSGLSDDIDSMQNELRMIGAAIEDHYKLRSQDTSAVTTEWVNMVRKLSHDIEDCMDLFLHRVTMKRHQSLVRRSADRLKTLRIRTRFAEKMKALRERATSANKKRQEYAVSGGGRSGSGGPSSGLSDGRTLEANLVGMEEPRKELLELLRETDDQVKKLKVVSIVGFDGLGKTTLAKDVFNDNDFRNNFEEHAWVDAADNKSDKILRAILEKFHIPVQENSSGNYLAELLRSHLQTKRYLIVIDDMQKGQWPGLRAAFPEELSSRIIVTTSIQSVAKSSSSGDHYIYKMKSLNHNDSQKLFFREASSELHQPNADSLLKKCEGIPLALICAAQYLQKNGELTWKSCADACHQLGHILEHDDTLESMKQLLLHKFVSLSGHYLKACMLYISMFPSDHHIRRNSMLRRWSAEGFTGANTGITALDVFKDLVDQNVVEYIEMSNNKNVKTCRTPGIMLEFLCHKSSSDNFIKFFSEETCETDYVRRLSLHRISDANRRRCRLHINLSLVRSLIIFGEAGEAILNLRKYKLLRVLDLEQCTDIRDSHLNVMCRLLHLKYVSLGCNITKVPRNIAWLHCLETLDMRKTKIKEVPLDVIRLPLLAHLYGKFQLRSKDCRKKKMQQFSSEGSNLQTLAGFVTDKNRGFPQLLFHMKKLRKVKIWCKSTADSRNLIDLAKSVREYIRVPMEPTDVRALSIDSDEWSEEFLTALQGPSYLSSLKLHGKLPDLPQFFTSVCYLSELQLSSTTLCGDCLLQGLSRLLCLLYLKLDEENLGHSMTIRGGDFGQLQCLCIVAKHPTSLQIEKEAAPCLTSLQLICEDLYGFPAMDDDWLPSLQKITLHQQVKIETIDGWNAAAKVHPNRPKVLQIIGDNDRNGDSDHTADRNVTQAVTNDLAAPPEIPSSVTHNSFAAPLTLSNISRPKLPPSGKRGLALNKVMKFPCFRSSQQVKRTEDSNDVVTDSVKRTEVKHTVGHL